MVNLTLQRRLAAQILKCAPEKVSFNPESLSEIKESITKADLKGLIGTGIVSVRSTHASSRGRARAKLVQKRKGLQKGHGSRKGTANTRTNRKETWMNHIRKLREFLRTLKSKGLISIKVYRDLANKAKGGFFRSQRHMKTYLNEHNLIIKESK